MKLDMVLIPLYVHSEMEKIVDKLANVGVNQQCEDVIIDACSILILSLLEQCLDLDHLDCNSLDGVTHVHTCV
jgi:hypothetical protein